MISNTNPFAMVFSHIFRDTELYKGLTDKNFILFTTAKKTQPFFSSPGRGLHRIVYVILPKVYLIQRQKQHKQVYLRLCALSQLLV